MSSPSSHEVRAYSDLVMRSDRLPASDVRPVLLGLFGEVGGILTAAKKLARESAAYREFRADVVEEFGDTLWYLAALARRLDVPFELLFPIVDDERRIVLPSEEVLYEKLFMLVRGGESLLEFHWKDGAEEGLKAFVHAYLSAVSELGLSFKEIMQKNSEKVAGRFLPIDLSELPRFDDCMSEDERLPEHFEFVIRQRKSGLTYISLNDVFVGDPLTDSIAEPDGYRFHDVFHMANAAILHWSPVLRALLKRKRKSNDAIDGSEDSGRAIVVEEGLSAWIFSRAKRQGMFEGATGLSFDMLKRISEFVKGYEVDRCPQALWERAVLRGFEAFRSLSSRGSGVIVGSRPDRTILFRS